MKPCRLVAATLVWVAAIVASGGRLAAHEEVPGVRAVVDSVTPALPSGVRIEAQISVADQLIAENTTDTELVVLGEGGEPFLRIGPEGVFANLKSPSWYRSNDPTGAARPPADASPTAAPSWARVTTEKSFGWFDHRMHKGEMTRPPAVKDPSKPVVLEEWTVPMRYGAVEVAVRGHREYKAPSGAWSARVLSSPPELRVLALPGLIPALTASRASGEAVVLGEAGEPMVRFGPDGTFVNEASPTWVFSAQAKGGYVASGAVGATEPPRWVRQAAGSVTWLDRRGQAATTSAEGHPGEKKAWRVPVESGGRRGEIVAETAWAARDDSAAPRNPVAPDDNERRWSWGSVAVVVALAGLILLGGRMLLTRRSSSMGE